MTATPPGPTGEPVFGSSRRYARDPFRFVEGLEAAYGAVSRFEMGPREIVVVTAPELIERVLVADADRYRKPEFQGDALGDLLGSGLLLSEGEAWERQRRLAAPAFTASRLAGVADDVAGHARSLVAGWEAGETVDVEREMTRVTLNVILDVMLGVDLPPERVRRIQADLAPLGARFEPDPLRFALPEWVPLTGDREYEAAVDSLERLIDDVVGARRGTAGTEAEGPTDFLSILLRARERGAVTDRQLRDELMTTLLAGHDTTALALTYTWYLLSEHPEAATRLHEEVDDVLGDEDPTGAHVREFEYLEWVLEEAMRLYPPVYTIFRTPTEPVTLGGYEVSPSASVMLPQWAVHRSERYWTAPERFDPERFRPERRADRHRFAFFPFGGGPRHCIGRRLAMLEATLIVATVARDYRLDYRGETPLDLRPSLTAHPRRELRMRVEAR